jgi:hypothetical protein
MPANPTGTSSAPSLAAETRTVLAPHQIDVTVTGGCVGLGEGAMMPSVTKVNVSAPKKSCPKLKRCI